MLEVDGGPDPELASDATSNIDPISINRDIMRAQLGITPADLLDQQKLDAIVRESEEMLEVNYLQPLYGPHLYDWSKLSHADWLGKT